LDTEQKSFDVGAKHFVKVCLGDFPQWDEFPNAGVGEQDVDEALVFPHRGIQLVKVSKV